MPIFQNQIELPAGAAAVVALVLPRVHARLLLSRAKHKSLAGHARWSRRFARLVPGGYYDEDMFFIAEGAPVDVAAKRRAAFERLSELYATCFAKSLALSREAREGISDLQF